MTLTKEDLQAIGEAVRPIVKTEIRMAMTEQNKMIAQGFTDLKAVMENTYVSREEFEQVKEELQNEVDDLKKQVQALQKRHPYACLTKTRCSRQAVRFERYCRNGHAESITQARLPHLYLS